MPFYEAGRAARGSFDAGIEQLVIAVLASPDFLYRAIVPPRTRGKRAVCAQRFASSPRGCRSSCGAKVRTTSCSSSPPRQIARSRRAAGAGAAHAGRSARRRPWSKEFALGWLNLDELDAVDPDERLFPEFSDELREDFATELTLFLSSILLEDRNVQEILTADRHVLERAARAPLRHHVRSRAAVPARDARRRDPLRAARQGCGAASHFVRRSHVARAARRLGARKAHGHAADAAAAERRDGSHYAPRASSRKPSARGSSNIEQIRPATRATA